MAMKGQEKKTNLFFMILFLWQCPICFPFLHPFGLKELEVTTKTNWTNFIKTFSFIGWVPRSSS